MAGKKIITVFGATGQQGGSVVDIFLNDEKLKNEWSVRAVTRDISKESAKKLAAKGAEIVQVCRLRRSSPSRSRRHMNLTSGIYRPIFLTTRHWTTLSPALKPYLPSPTTGRRWTRHWK